MRAQEYLDQSGTPMDAEAEGTIAGLIAVLMAALASPPMIAERAMALVVTPGGGGDHLGLQLQGQATPGGLELLNTVILSRARPQATVFLEWTTTGSVPQRFYRGWSVWRRGEVLAWRHLAPTEVRAHAGLRPGVPLQDDPTARFDL